MLMRAGTGFNYNRRRYEAGDKVDMGSVPAHLHGTFTRLYGLTAWPKFKKKEFGE